MAGADVAARALISLAPATRAEAAAAILTAAEREAELVVGLDFSFSMPAWWLDTCGVATAPELWADADRLEGWLADCPSPFWGRPGRRRPPRRGHPLRVTERLAPGRPGSVFQIGGAGAVGTASLRGMPTLLRLREAGLSVWPFQPWALPAVVEVWPRLALGPMVKSDTDARRRWVGEHRTQLSDGDGMATSIAGSADALDAAAAALWLADRATTPRPEVTDPIVVREGWIDGVPLPTRATAGAYTRARRKAATIAEEPEASASHTRASSP